MMKEWKKYVSLAVVALLLIGAVYMNVRLNAKESANGLLSAGESNEPMGGLLSAGLESTGAKDYFEAFREDRNAQRTLEKECLNEVIATSGQDDEKLADAQAEIIALVSNMEKEFVMESLIKAKGFEDVAVMYKPGSVNVVVKAVELQRADVAKILDIVKSETGEKADNITIQPNS